MHARVRHVSGSFYVSDRIEACAREVGSRPTLRCLMVPSLSSTRRYSSEAATKRSVVDQILSRLARKETGSEFHVGVVCTKESDRGHVHPFERGSDHLTCMPTYFISISLVRGALLVYLCTCLCTPLTFQIAAASPSLIVLLPSWVSSLFSNITPSFVVHRVSSVYLSDLYLSVHAQMYQAIFCAHILLL